MGLDMKGPVEKRHIGIFAKLNIVKTTPNFACKFVYMS